MLGKKPGIFQRTLNRMVEEGILLSEYRANARYFRANKNYPLYEELKSIVFKTVGVVGGMRDLLQEIGGVRLAFIYGSYAKEKEDILSDIDLFIVGNVDEDKLIRELDRLEGLLRREVNYKLYSMREFRRDLKEKEPFLKEVLHDKKIFLIGDEDELQRIVEK